MNEYVHKVIALYTSDSASSSPENFHRWLVEPSFEAAKADALRRLWDQSPNVSEEETAAALASLKLKSQFMPRPRRRAVRIWRYAAAVALCVSLAAGYIFTHRAPAAPVFAEYFSGGGLSETVQLPDGSTLQTNSATLIVYPVDFGKSTRTLYLSGEANFKVVKNRALPFVVKSKYTEVEALGTEFTVASYAEDRDVKVTLISGRIKVEATDNQTDFILDQSGEQFVYNKQEKQYAISQVDLHDATAWQRGELVFRGMTVPDILTVLERRYDVSFQYNFSSVNDDRFNFYFKKETSLADIMEIINTVAGRFDYAITNQQINN
ncbi:MAG: DUF4974 domain-containing protein [Prevotellaceae bacterium]|jgi:ferric-dicitrate binding protein FerR (iron transport regulator)|nr:DUF4974 domain-containing protein [Prevotellaceae bacterium]